MFNFEKYKQMKIVHKYCAITNKKHKEVLNSYSNITVHDSYEVVVQKLSNAFLNEVTVAKKIKEMVLESVAPSKDMEFEHDMFEAIENDNPVLVQDKGVQYVNLPLKVQYAIMQLMQFSFLFLLLKLDSGQSGTLSWPVSYRILILECITLRFVFVVLALNGTVAH